MRDSMKGTKTIIEELLNKWEDKTLEYYYSLTKECEVRAFNKEIAAYNLSSSSGLSVRCAEAGRIGFAFTEKITQDALEGTTKKAVDNSRFGEPDPGNLIYDKSGRIQSSRFYKGETESYSPEEKRRTALLLEDLTYKLDKRIINVPYAMCGDIVREVRIRNSHGVDHEGLSTLCYTYVSCIARDGEDTQVGSYFQIAPVYDDLNLETSAKRAVEEALSLLGAGEVESGRYPVVLSAEAASSLFAAFISSSSSPFSAENIQKGRSKIAGKIGQKIGSDLTTLADDPLSFGMGCAEFDDEGAPTKKTFLVKEGVFVTPLYNNYAAKRENRETTGHGRRGSYMGGIEILPFNPYLENGSKGEKDLFLACGKGIYITALEGLHAGINQISGDFSLGAKGFLFQGGEKGKAIGRMTVAGNFFDLLKAVQDKADNRRLDNYTPFSSPSLLIESLSVSGK